MAAFDFPNTPALGEKFPTAPAPGQVQYTWDGEKWTTVGPQITTALPATELPLMDGLTASVGISSKYAREDHIHMSEGAGTFVAKTGDVMTGMLAVTIPDGYTGLLIAGATNALRVIPSAGQTAIEGVDQTGTATYQPLVIGGSALTFNAPTSMIPGYDFALGKEPTHPLHATTKGYVDAVKAWAAPLDALAYNGMQINGSMDVSQENAGVAIAPADNANAHVIDGWRIQSGGVQRFSAFQNPSGPAGFGFSLMYAVITANPAPLAGHYAMFMQSIEGYRVSRLAFGTGNQPITVGFWVYSSVRAGVLPVSVRNADSTRSYVAPVTINVAGAWEYKTVTIPADTTGTWAKNNGIGLSIGFTMLAGSTYVAPPNTWVAGNFISVAGAANFAATAADGLAITGVVVLPGTEAPTAAQSPLIMRPYDQELLTCQRYFQKFGGSTAAYEPFANGRANLATEARMELAFSPMRAAPTLTFSAGASFVLAVPGNAVTVTAMSAATISTRVATVMATCAGGLLAGQGTSLLANNTTPAWINLDARL